MKMFDMKAGLPIYEILDMKACRITTLFWGRGEGKQNIDDESRRGKQEHLNEG
jgi:hypothetical protein